VGAFVEIAALGKTYPTPAGPAEILRDFTLYVAEGEFVCLLGHSGCGKTTVLSILMGLNQPSTGGVVIDGREIDGPGVDRGVVFQSATLLPWMSVRDNVRLALDQVPRAARPEAGADAVESYLEAVGLRGLGQRYPRELSAGMQQRVGVARAFSLEPRLLLLDEPFSLLDALTRMELQDELIALWERSRRTVVMVTHDVDEALLLADRIVLMTSGPAATIGEVLTVPFPRPRRREEILARPDYFWMRDQVLAFLEAQPVHA
jgi:nitrate ABC transporter ATP-binding subunit